MAKRKVHFYRINAGLDQSGNLLPFNPAPACSEIHGLPFDPTGRYLDQGDGNVLCCWIDRQRSPQYVQLGVVRRGNLPQVEQRGRLQPLPLHPQAGIVESTQIVLFPNNILGSLFNFYGPRAGRLSYYLKKKCTGIPSNLKVEPLLRHDVLHELDRMGEVRVLELGIHRSFIQRVGEASESLQAAFTAAEQASGAERLEIVLRPPAYKRQWLSRGLLDSIRSLARMGGVHDEVAKFKVTGLTTDDGQVDTIDLLRDKFVAEAEVQLEEEGRSRAVVPSSAFRAITQAYSGLREELVAAAAIV